VIIPALKAERGNIATTKTDVTAYFVFEDKTTLRHEFQKLTKHFPSAAITLDATTFSGKESESLTLYIKEKRKKKIILVGLGKNEHLTLEKLRRAAATALKVARNLKASSLAIIEPDTDVIEWLQLNEDWQGIGTALAEGAMLSSYTYDKYITKKENSRLQRIILVSDDAERLRRIAAGATSARIISEATFAARDLANAPPNEIFPESLAKRAQELVGKKVSTTILDERSIKKLGMGGVLAVAQGSDRPPRFIIMEYGRTQRNAGTIVLVGKGVTFDSGGISIKPASGMSEMKSDMAGAAAVIATMQALAKLKLPLHVVALIPTVENLLGGKAMKPGDIITHLNGKTSEVDNTDAEGRLILADALAYASRYKPQLVIDVATLTGACVVALGHHATGMMGNDDEAMTQLKAAGERTYERVWQLPLFDEYEKLNKSDVADVKNSGGRWAGAITAALFLKHFIGNYKWVHLDIAGTSFRNEALDYVPKGASGVGVRLLVEFLRRRTTER
jgi:leucyl aminopeptidase